MMPTLHLTTFKTRICAFSPRNTVFENNRVADSKQLPTAPIGFRDRHLTLFPSLFQPRIPNTVVIRRLPSVAELRQSAFLVKNAPYGGFGRFAGDTAWPHNWVGAQPQ
jgi:hypothetical protein